MAKTKGTTEVLDVLEQEVQLVRDDSSIIEKFTGKLRAFFTEARALETSAKGYLDRANKLTVPHSMQEDEALQFFIKDAGAVKKTVVDHWDITAKVHAFHKRLVAARKRSEDPLEQAVSIATRFHNTYVENERRRVAEQQERLRREAEQQAQDDRQAELKRLEDEAVKAEEASADLSVREQDFIHNFVVHPRTRGDGSLAAERAGYKDPFKTAARLLSLPKIMVAIEAKRQAEALRTQAAAVNETPLDVQVPTVDTRISTAGGHDRTSYSVEVTDPRLFLEAVVGGRHGIPVDCLMVNQPKVNEYGRSMRELVNRWPGCRLVKKTSLV